MHSSRLQSGFVLSQSLPPAKLSASADVKPLGRSVNAVHAPRIVMEERRLLGLGRSYQPGERL
jgi:hypothetical protein